MELREYLRVVFGNMWLIIPLTLLAASVTAVFSYSQPAIYESNATYVTRLDSTLSSIGDTIYGLDTLLGRQRIFVTYCDVMSSSSTVDRALGIINIVPDQLDWDKEYAINCIPVPESNVLQMSVRGTSPVIVERLNQAIGQIGTARINDLYNFFPVETLDPVVLQPDPVAPNHLTNIALGAALGVVMSVALAFLLDYLRKPEANYEVLSIRDPELAVYKDSYFKRRLQEEFERAQLHYRTLSVSYIRVIPTEDFDILPESVKSKLMRNLALDMQNYHPPANIVAYSGENIFEILIPERAGTHAKSEIQAMIDTLIQKVYHHDQYRAVFEFNAVVVESDGEKTSLTELQQKGLKALSDMQLKRRNQVVFVSTVAKPFDDASFDLDDNESQAFILDIEDDLNIGNNATPKANAGGQGTTKSNQKPTDSTKGKNPFQRKPKSPSQDN